MRLTSTGLGIGTSSPAHKLDVNGRIRGSDVGLTSTSNWFYFDNFSGSNFMGLGGGTSLQTYVGGSLRTTIDSSGNLGIGKTPTDKPLEIYASASPALRIQNSTTGTGANDGLLLEMSGSNINFYNYEAGAIVFGTSATERARIDSSGQLLIGVTSLPSAGSGGAGFRADSNGRRNLYLSTSSTSNNGLIYFSNPNGEVGSITVSGSATAYNTSSDYRLKNITGALTGYKERLMSLQPKQGTWKADGSEFRGFLAHEFAEPYSASVTGEKDAVDADNKPIMQAMQASSSEVMADLVALVKEQQAIIESLKARLDAANL
jgi:hypothetical protein